MIRLETSTTEVSNSKSLAERDLHTTVQHQRVATAIPFIMNKKKGNNGNWNQPHDWVFYKWVREYWRWYMKSNWVHRLTMQSHKFQFLRPSRSLFLYSSFPYFNSIQHKRIITTYKIFPMYKPNDWWFINPTKTANILYQQWNSDKNKHKIYMEKLFSEKEPMRIFF